MKKYLFALCEPLLACVAAKEGPGRRKEKDKAAVTICSVFSFSLISRVFYLGRPIPWCSSGEISDAEVVLRKHGSAARRSLTNTVPKASVDSSSSAIAAPWLGSSEGDA